MKIETFQHQGKRKYQQDAFYINKDIGIYIICDGVGGSTDGEKASKMAITSIKEFFFTNLDKNPCQSLKGAINNAQKHLEQYQILNPEFGNSGTTVAIVLIKDQRAFTAHMGDSKVIFFKRNSEKYWQTKDHSMVQELFEAGILKNEEDMFSHPLKNRITNGLFAKRKNSTLNIPIHELNNLEKGDIFILCTDGVLESYRPGDMFELYKNSTIEKATEEISHRVQINSSDNSTFILIQI